MTRRARENTAKAVILTKAEAFSISIACVGVNFKVGVEFGIKAEELTTKKKKISAFVSSNFLGKMTVQSEESPLSITSHHGVYNTSFMNS